MTNKKLMLGILVMVLVFGMVVIGCGGGGTGGRKAKITFTNSKLGTSQQNIRAISHSYVETEKDTVLDVFYASLGTLKNTYTPDEFSLDNITIRLYNSNKQIFVYSSARNNQLGHSTTIDFVNPVIYEGDEIEPGTYTGFAMGFLIGKSEKSYGDGSGKITGFWNFNPSVTFTVEGMGNHPYANNTQIIPNSISGWDYWRQYAYLPGGDYYNLGKTAPPDWLWDVRVSGNNYTLSSHLIFPSGVRAQGIDIGNLPLSKPVDGMIFYSNQKKLISSYGDAGSMTWLVDNLGFPNFFRDNDTGGTLFLHAVVAPYSGITIPKDASTVLFTVHWDLENIIERYEGPTDSPDDDIYILAKDFYTRFALTANIEY